MLFLPEYYGLELSQSLPVISVSRMIFVVFCVYVVLNRRTNLNLKQIKLRSMPKSYWLLLGYFVIRFLTNLRYAFVYAFAAKAILALILEDIFLLIGLFLLAPTADEINSIIKTIVWTACGLFIIGICEGIFSITPFDALYTVSRTILNDHYVRLGLNRAVTTMGLANYYGNFCLMMTPLIYYLLKKTHERKYIVALFLDFLAMIHSGCRSDLIFFGFVTFIYLILTVLRREDIGFFLRALAVFLVGITLYSVIACSCNERLNYYYTGTAKAVLNTFGFKFDYNANSPEGVSGYGNNERGVLSRTAQISGISYVLGKEPIFGLGRGCQIRKELRYFYEGKWRVSRTMDMGIVEVICTEGLLGLLAYILLFGSYILILLKQRNRRDLPLDFTTYCMMPFIYLLCTLSTANMTFYLIFITALLFGIEDSPIKR